MLDSVEALGISAREAGPLDEKTGHFITCNRCGDSCGRAVHSHVRRALAAGASIDEIYHAIVLLISTIGFPTTAAAIS